MARIRLEAVAHSDIRRPHHAEDFVLQPLDADWPDGSAIALVGEPGSGAGTLLRILGGFVQPLRGRVCFDDADVTGLSPQARRVAQLFRDPVVYPTLTVRRNLAVAPQQRGVAGATLADRVARIAEVLDLTALLDVPAGVLDRAGRQTVALGRALSNADVGAVLFDDPLAGIDDPDRAGLRRLLRRAQAAFPRTFVFALQDLADASSVADRILLFEDGRVVQSGRPEVFLDEPAAPRVGESSGSSGMNLIPISVVDGVPRFAGRPLAVATPEQVIRWLGAQQSAAPSAALRLGIRPECVGLARPGDAGSVEAELERVRDLGTSMLITARIGDSLVRARVPVDSDAEAELALAAGAPDATGRRVHLSIVNPDSRFFRDETLIQ